MFTITELPRSEGVVVGQFRARHRSNSFSNEGYGFKFVNGVTEKALFERVPDRLSAAYGSDVDYLPCDEKSAEMALAWMRKHQVAASRIERAETAAAVMFMAPGVVTQVAPVVPPVQAAAQPTTPSTPTTWADLERLTEEPLRIMAADLGCTDRRWKEPRLRRFIADELGIETVGAAHGD